MSDDKISYLPVSPRQEANDEFFLEPVPPFRMAECNHGAGFLVNESEAEVTCKQCGIRLNPMWVLSQLAKKETHWHRQRAAYQDEMARLSKRSQTKCMKCGEMTRISHR